MGLSNNCPVHCTIEPSMQRGWMAQVCTRDCGSGSDSGSEEAAAVPGRGVPCGRGRPYGDDTAAG